MEELIQSLKKLQSMVVKMYAQAHGYHWNVEGSGFPQYHEKLLEVYEDVYSSIDPLSENIRKFGAKAPFGTKAWEANSELTINDSEDLDARTMFLELIQTNTVIIAMLKRTCDQANQADEQGLVNFLADRLDKHKFWQWQLTSTIK